MADYVLSVKIEGDASDLQREAKNATSSISKISTKLSKMSSKLRDGLGFGVLVGIGQKAFDKLSSAASGFVEELESTSAAWQTFEKNAQIEQIFVDRQRGSAALRQIARRRPYDERYKSIIHNEAEIGN